MINQGRNVTCFIQKESTWLTKKLVSWINFLVSANLQNIFFVLFLHLTRTQNIYRIKAFFVSFQTNLIKFDSFMVYRLHFLLIKKVQHWYSYTAYRVHKFWHKKLAVFSKQISLFIVLTPSVFTSSGHLDECLLACLPNLKVMRVH